MFSLELLRESISYTSWGKILVAGTFAITRDRRTAEYAPSDFPAVPLGRPTGIGRSSGQRL
jgi:hypothetical protein